MNKLLMLEKHEHTFEPVAREWMASNVQWGEGYADQVKRTLERETDYLFFRHNLDSTGAFGAPLGFVY